MTQNKKGWIEAHTPERLARWLDGVCTYTQVKWGVLKRGEGDIVVINPNFLIPEHISLEDYIKYIYGDVRIEQKGIYLNIFFSRKFFEAYFSSFTVKNTLRILKSPKGWGKKIYNFFIRVIYFQRKKTSKFYALLTVPEIRIGNYTLEKWYNEPLIRHKTYRLVHNKNHNVLWTKVIKPR